MGQLQGMKGAGPSPELREKFSPGNVAKAKVFRISDNQNVQQKALTFTTQERRTLWIAVIVSILVIVGLVYAIKDKYIKL